MNVPKNWMLESGGSFKILIAKTLYPLDRNIGS